MKIAREMRVGNVFKMKDKLYLVLKALFHKSTSGRRASSSEMKFKLMELISKNKSDLTVDATDKMDNVILDRVSSQVLYKDSAVHFMNQESYEQFSMDIDNLGDAAYFLVENMVVNVLFYESNPVSIDLPQSVDLKITYTENAIRGDTSGRAVKPAVLESGLELQVPLFCNIDDTIRVSTERSEYMERV